jgi:hypothetical protein
MGRIVFLLTAALAAQDKLIVKQTDRIGCIVENAFFRADLSQRVVNGVEEDNGTLRGLTYKQFEVTLLRSQNRMHWAPSLQRAGARGYTSIGVWNPVQKFERLQSDQSFILKREGYLQGYPEVKLETEYTFHAGVPYFIFRSTMTVEKPVELYWVRNQEMTMDAFFTHVAWPGRDGRARIASFDERGPILEKEPIPVDAPWVAFVNLDKGYGYGAIVLDYKATMTAGKAMTSINDGVNNGRYWDRRLINQVNTKVEPGTRWEERTAYVLFHAPKDAPVLEFLDWVKRLRKQ